MLQNAISNSPSYCIKIPPTRLLDSLQTHWQLYFMLHQWRTRANMVSCRAKQNGFGCFQYEAQEYIFFSLRFHSAVLDPWYTGVNKRPYSCCKLLGPRHVCTGSFKKVIQIILHYLENLIRPLTRFHIKIKSCVVSWLYSFMFTEYTHG